VRLPLSITSSVKKGIDVGRHGNGTLGDQSNPVYSEWVKIPRKGGPKGSDLCHAGGLLRRQ